jgi:hypothetical protein
LTKSGDCASKSLVRAQGKELVEAMVARLTADEILRNVFLAVDGKRSQSEIVERVKRSGKSGSNATISRKVEVLVQEMHLIELADRTAKGKIYKRTKLDRILGISRRLGA